MEKLIKSHIQPYTNKVSSLQAGSRENKSTCDIYIINSLIDHAIYLKTKLYISLYDYETCFDSLWLEDSMISIWDLGINDEMFSLI